MNATEIFNLLQIVQHEFEAINHQILAEQTKELKKRVAKDFSLI